MEPNRLNSFWENYEKPIFDPFWPRFDPLSRERASAWTCNLAHICRIIISIFSGRWNQIGRLIFEKISKSPFLTHFDPYLTLYLQNEKWPGLETWHEYVEWWYLPFLGDGTKSSEQLLRKLRKTNFWPILTPIWPSITGTSKRLDLKLGTHMKTCIIFFP